LSNLVKLCVLAFFLCFMCSCIWQLLSGDSPLREDSNK